MSECDAVFGSKRQRGEEGLKRQRLHYSNLDGGAAVENGTDEGTRAMTSTAFR